MIVFTRKVFEGGISGTGDIYTAAELNSVLAQADKWFVQARASQTTGTSPTLAVVLEHSNDNVTFTAKTTLISASSIPVNTVTYLYGNDAGSTPAGGYVRLKMTLGGTTPGGQIEVWLTGRSE